MQRLGRSLSIHEGTAIHDFEEFTFCAPRPGSFLGDPPAPVGDMSPIIRFEQQNSDEEIPPCVSSWLHLSGLEAIATELLCQIFVHLDICSLLAFRHVNQHAKSIVDTFPPFRSIATFPKLLGAVEALQCRSWTVETLMRCVLDERCSMCWHFGDFLYLVTPERWCYRCWLRDGRLVVQRIPPSIMSQEEALRICQHVPSVRLSMGYYGLTAKVPVSQPMLVFDLRALRFALPAASSWPHGHVSQGHPLRYTTVIRAPYWDALTARFEEGFFCKACSSHGWNHRSRQSLAPFRFKKYPVWGLPSRRYTRDGMKVHIDRYGRIFKIQTIEGEVQYVHEKPFVGYTWDVGVKRFDICPTLQGCLEKEAEYLQEQPFLGRYDQFSNRSEIEEVP